MEPEISHKCEKCRKTLELDETHLCAHKKRLLSYCWKCIQKACPECVIQKSLGEIKVQVKREEEPDGLTCGLCTLKCKVDYVNLGGLIICLLCVNQNQVSFSHVKSKKSGLDRKNEERKNKTMAQKPYENKKEEILVMPQFSSKQKNKTMVSQSSYKREVDHRLKLQKELDQVENVLMCSICFQKRKNCINSVCNHLACCFQCGSKERNCPLCRADMKPIKIFL